MLRHTEPSADDYASHRRTTQYITNADICDTCRVFVGDLLFIQPDRTQASQTLRHVADQLRQKWPKLASFIDDSETDVLSHLDFPEQHRTKITAQILWNG